jgi:hypothetical protein
VPSFISHACWDDKSTQARADTPHGALLDAAAALAFPEGNTPAAAIAVNATIPAVRMIDICLNSP